ncbi:MAG: hypothetical protein JSR36_03710 [Proteobacteria bacterium]|nr:hypothetical protein [Pseudomonadota bacterium]
MAGLLVAATAHAEFVRVTAANSVGNSVYDVTSLVPGGPGTTSPLNTDGASHGSYSSLIQLANLATGTVDVIVTDATKNQIVRYTPAVGATPAAVTVLWTGTSSSPCSPALDGLSADAAGNLFFVLQNKPIVCVLPVSANSATGYAKQPLVVDVNGYSSLGAAFLRDTTVATIAGHGWNVGDLLVLGSSKNSSNKTLVFVYRAASLQSVLNGGGARNGPDVALISPGQFIWGGNPMGMDIWPADAVDATPTLLITSTTGQVLRFDFTLGQYGYSPQLVQTFATGLGSGLLKLKEGLQLGVPYAFVTSSSPGNGQILMLGAPVNGSTNLIGIATQGVQSPNALAVARQAAIPTQSCVSPLTCDLSGGVAPHTITGNTAPIGGNVLEASCVILSDPRVDALGNCDGTNLNVAKLCPGFGNEIIPGTMCGSAGASKSGFALLRTQTTQGDVIPGILVRTEENVDNILPATPPATNPLCPLEVLAWVPYSGASPSEGSIVEVDSSTGLLQMVDMTTFCGSSGGSNRGLSIWGVGLKLNLNALNGGMLGFAQTKYTNLFATVSGANIKLATQTTLEAALTPIQTYLTAGDYACAAAQVLSADTLVANDADPPGNYPGNAANPNPWGEIRGRLGNLYMTINTRLAGNPPNSAWPLAPTDPLPQCGPPAVTLTAAPASIAPGNTSTITWSTTHATSCAATGAVTGDAGWSNVSGTSGSYTTVARSSSGTYSLSCTGPGGTTTKSATVTVVPAPVISSFTPAASSVPVGGSTTLTWTATTDGSCSVTGLGSGTQNPDGSYSVNTGPLQVTTTFTLVCNNSVSTSVTVSTTVTVVPVPVITSFVVTPSTIPAGGSAVLTWSESTGASCGVNGLPGGSGVSTGAVSTTTTYTLTCTSVGGTATASVVLTVLPPPAITSFKATPSNVDPDCQRDGLPSSCSYTTLSWTTTNATVCAISGGGLSKTGLPANGSLLSNKITAKTTFALGCSNAVNTSTSATTTVTYLDLDDGGGD